MPTYDFQCPDCGHEFEAFQAMTARPLKLCPKCGKRRVRRLIGSGLAPIFKGSGFYQTDYKPTKEPTESKPETSAKAEGSGSKEGASKATEAPAKADKPAKTETKPAKAKK